MAERNRIPPIQPLMDGDWRVVIVVGFIEQPTTNRERQVVVLVESVRSTQNWPLHARKEVDLSVTLLPLLKIGALFEKGIYIEEKASRSVCEGVLEPTSGLLLRLKDKPQGKDLKLSYGIADSIAKRFLTLSTEESLKYRKMAFLQFRQQNCIYIIPVIEIIRYYFSLMSSSYVMRRIFSGILENMHGIENLINTKKSFTTDTTVHVTLKKNLVDEDRLILGGFYFNQEGHYANQLRNVTASLKDSSNIEHQIAYPVLLFPFTDACRFESHACHQRNVAHEQVYDIYLVTEICSSDHPNAFETLNYGRDNNNISKLLPGEKRHLRVAWKNRGQRPSAPKRGGDGSLLPGAPVDTNREAWNFVLAEEVNRILNEIPGAKVSNDLQLSKHEKSPELPEPSKNPFGTDDLVDGGDADPFNILPAPTPDQTKPDEKGPSVQSPRLSDFTDTMTAIYGMGQKILNLDYIFEEFTYTSRIGRIKTYNISQYHEVRYKSNTPEVCGILARISLNHHYFYVFDISTIDRKAPLVVFWKDDYGDCSMDDLYTFLDESARIRERWLASGQMKPHVKGLTCVGLRHAYTSHIALRNGILDHCGLEYFTAMEATEFERAGLEET